MAKQISVTMAVVLGFILLAASLALAEVACTMEIKNTGFTQCVNGYEWMYKHEKDGCHVYAVPVSQKFEIYPKKSGKPKIMLPVPCSEIEVVHIP